MRCGLSAAHSPPGAAGCRTPGSGAGPPEQASRDFRRCGFQPRRWMCDHGKHWRFRLFSAFLEPRGRDARAPAAHPLSSLFPCPRSGFHGFQCWHPSRPGESQRGDVSGKRQDTPPSERGVARPWMGRACRVEGMRQGPRRGEYCGWPSRQAWLRDGHPQYSPRRPSGRHPPLGGGRMLARDPSARVRLFHASFEGIVRAGWVGGTSSPSEPPGGGKEQTPICPMPPLTLRRCVPEASSFAIPCAQGRMPRTRGLRPCARVEDFSDSEWPPNGPEWEKCPSRGQRRMPPDKGRPSLPACLGKQWGGQWDALPER